MLKILLQQNRPKGDIGRRLPANQHLSWVNAAQCPLCNALTNTLIQMALKALAPNSVMFENARQDSDYSKSQN